MKTEIVQGISKKTNREYVRLDIYLTDTYVKSVFLDRAEAELIKVSQNNL